MDSNNPKLKALNALKLSSVAYLDAQNQGEAAAVAAFAEGLKEYNRVTLSKDYRDITKKSAFTPKSGLGDIDIDEFLAGVNKFRDCQANKVTDAQVRAFVSLAKPPSGNGNVHREALEKPTNASSSNVYSSQVKLQPVRNADQKSLEVPDFNLTYHNGVGPPSKVFAQAISPRSQEKTLFEKMEQRFLGKGSAGQPPASSSYQSSASTSYQRPLASTSHQPSAPTSYQQPSASTSYQTSSRVTPLQPATYSCLNSKLTPVQSPVASSPGFTSASNELKAQNLKRYGTSSNIITQRMGLSRDTVSNGFKPPLSSTAQETGNEDHPLLKGIDPKLLEIIQSEVVVNAKEVTWDDIAGLDEAKDIIQEVVILPLLRPDLFQGLREIPKGILLFGPPGTGKTLIGKCIASQSDATFLSISASTLTSKWIGEGEKLVRALFVYARVHQPSVIFLDEIDSILKKRSDTENEASRRLKTEFLIQFDGANSIQDSDRVLLVGATNLPQELDEAARRRFTKRLYIPLPEQAGRRELLARLLQKNANSLTEGDLDGIAAATNGYSGADIKTLCSDASMSCLRELPKSQIRNIDVNSLRPINVNDFQKSLKRVKATVSPKELQHYVDWNQNYGSTT